MTDGDYSHRTLVERLGIKPGENMTVINGPSDYDALIDEWPVGASVSRDVLDESYSMIHVFMDEPSELASAHNLVEHLAPGGRIWASWRKGGRGGANETKLREAFLPLGLVDNKVAAIDDEWSALRFVRRRAQS